MKKISFVFIFFVVNFFAFAQQEFSFELKLFGGRVFPHRIGMESLAKDNSKGIELNFLNRKLTQNVFNKKYNFPTLGVGFSAELLGNPQELGNSYSSYFFGDFNFNNWIGLRLYSGITYLTKKYDKILNPNNIAIGTNLNYYFNLSFPVNFNYKKTAISFAGGLIHFSNGSVRKPNLGINQLYLSLALKSKFYINSKQQMVYLPENFSKSEFWLMATLISSDDYTVKPESRGGGYICSTISAGYNFRYDYIAKFGFSIDCFYNSNYQYYYDTNWDTLILFYPDPIDVLQIGFGIGHNLIYSRLEFLTYGGFYFYNKVKPKDHFYTRIGARYYVCDYMFVNLTLKAFGFKAHYIESGIGFSYRSRNKDKT